MTHTHHIIPRHMGGSDHPSNLIELTVVEHAEEHKILWWLYGHWQDELAWKALSGTIGKEEIIKKVLSESGKKSTGMKGKKHSEETKLKIGIASKKNILSKEIRSKIAKSNTGKKRSNESKERMRLAQIGKKLTMEHKNKISISHMGDLNPGKVYKGKTWIKDSNGKRVWIDRKVA